MTPSFVASFPLYADDPIALVDDGFLLAAIRLSSVAMNPAEYCFLSILWGPLRRGLINANIALVFIIGHRTGGTQDMRISADITKDEVEGYRIGRRKDAFIKVSDMFASLAALATSATLFYFDLLVSNNLSHMQVISQISSFSFGEEFIFDRRLAARLVLVFATMIGILRSLAIFFNTFVYQRRIDKIEIETGKITDRIEEFAKNAGTKNLKIMDENEKNIKRNIFASVYFSYFQYSATLIGTALLLYNFASEVVQ